MQQVPWEALFGSVLVREAVVLQAILNFSCDR